MIHCVTDRQTASYLSVTSQRGGDIWVPASECMVVWVYGCMCYLAAVICICRRLFACVRVCVCKRMSEKWENCEARKRDIIYINSPSLRQLTTDSPRLTDFLHIFFSSSTYFTTPPRAFGFLAAHLHGFRVRFRFSLRFQFNFLTEPSHKS